MYRAAILLALVASLAPLGTTPVLAQTDTIPAALRVRHLPRQKLSGPRFGFTVFTGEVASQRREYLDKGPIMSQFGWQFETQIVSTESGNQALMEWVVLVGGVEQDELNLSLSWLAGYRLPNGFELGVGPAMSVRKEGGDPTTSMVVAGGATLPFGELYIPMNLAVAFAQGGPRFTALLGWIIG